MDKDQEKKTDSKKKNKSTSDPSKYIDIDPKIDEESELFELALEGEFDLFVESLPEELLEYAEELYDAIRMNEEELEERGPLTVQQRRARGRSMKRRSGRNKMARKRAASRKASPAKLKARAKKRARNSIRDRLSGGKSYSKMSATQKYQVDKRLSKIPASKIDRLATRELPKVRKAETQRLANRSKKNEDLNETVAGTRPIKPFKVFHKMFNKDSTVKCDKRFKQFKPKKSDDLEEDFLNDVLDLKESVENYITESDYSWEREEGTDELVSIYKNDTPGQEEINDTFGDFESGDRVRFIKRSIDSGIGYTEIEGTVIGSNVQHLRIRDDEGKLYRVKHDDAVLIEEQASYFTLDEAFELRFLDEESMKDKAVAAIRRHVLKGEEFDDVLSDLLSHTGVNIGTQELIRHYIKTYGDPKQDKTVDPQRAAQLKRKYM